MEQQITGQTIMNAITAVHAALDQFNAATTVVINDTQKALADQRAEIATLRAAIAQLAEHGIATTTEAPYVYWIKSSERGEERCLTVHGNAPDELRRKATAVEDMFEWESVPTPPATVGAPAQARKSFCEFHETEMGERTSGKDHWFSHKDGEGWCRGADANGTPYNGKGKKK